MPKRSVSVWILLGALALTGCAGHEPRCDGALEPVNAPAALPRDGAQAHTSHGAHAS